MYLCRPEPVTQTPGPEGSQRCTTVFHLPARVLPGVYQVFLKVIQDGHETMEKHQEFSIVKVGLPALVSNLAQEQSVLYGLAAVLITLIAGFLMGFFFKSKGAH